jgi:hypothetical protein
MGNFSDKSFQQAKTHVLLAITFFLANRAVCDVIWKNVVQPDRPQMTIK